MISCSVYGLYIENIQYSKGNFDFSTISDSFDVLYVRERFLIQIYFDFSEYQIKMLLNK